MLSKKYSLTVLLGLVLCFSGFDQAMAKVTPGDVYKSVAVVRADLGLIREKLKKEKNVQPELAITNATPREVFSLVKSMQEKVGQLYRERTDKAPDLLVFVPKGNITPKDVLAISDSAMDILKLMKKALNITEERIPQIDSSSMTPTDVIKSIIQANRQLNLMLDEKVTPSDVYQRVEQSINYAYVLRQQFPSAQIPALPTLVSASPGDVYNLLINCFRIQRKIMVASGLKALDIDSSVAATKDTKPADVYDIASLVFSEVRSPYFAIKNRRLTPGVFYPGKKGPAHAYQKAGALEAQLTELLKLVEKDPGWLQREGSKIN